MDTLTQVVKILLFSLAFANIVYVLKLERNNMNFIQQIWRRFRRAMLLQCLLALASTSVLAYVLITYVPGTSFSWTGLLLNDGGNIFTAPLIDASSNEYVAIRLLALLLILAFLLILPFLAKFEEEIFRKGHSDWKSISWESTKFGLVHCLVGVPIGFGIALIVTGFFYGYHYKRALEKNMESFGYLRAEEEAVMVSTTYHTMYNSIIVTVLLVGSVTMI